MAIQRKGRAATAPKAVGATKKRSRRLTGEERRHSILTEARELFKTRGVRGTSMREIASYAGVNEALIYRYFPSKEDLFFEAILEPLEEAIGASSKRAQELPYHPDLNELHDWLKELTSHLLQVVTETLPSFGMIVFGDRELATRFYKRSLGPMLKNIEQMLEENRARWPHRDFDPALAVSAGLGTCLMVALRAHLSGKPYDADQVTTEIADLFMHGLMKSPAKAPRRQRARTGS